MSPRRWIALRPKLQAEYGMPRSRPVVVQGLAEPISPDDEARIIAAMQAKYGRDSVPDSFEALAGLGFCVRPVGILSWTEFPRDVTHWVPPPEPTE